MLQFSADVSVHLYLDDFSTEQALYAAVDELIHDEGKGKTDAGTFLKYQITIYSKPPYFDYP